MELPKVGEQAGPYELWVLQEFEFEADAAQVQEFILRDAKGNRWRGWLTRRYIHVVRFAPIQPYLPFWPPGVLCGLDFEVCIREEELSYDPSCRQLTRCETAQHSTVDWHVVLGYGTVQVWLYQTRSECCVGQMALDPHPEHWKSYPGFVFHADEWGQSRLGRASFAVQDGALRVWADLVGAWSKRHDQDRGYAERSGFEPEKPEAAAQPPRRQSVTGKPREPDGLQSEVASGSEAAEQSAPNEPWLKIPSGPQREAVRLLWQGLQDPEIAARIGVRSAKTVSNWFSGLRKHYGRGTVPTRADLRRKSLY